jgi:hypothetical protein
VNFSNGLSKKPNVCTEKKTEMIKMAMLDAMPKGKEPPPTHCKEVTPKNNLF